MITRRKAILNAVVAGAVAAVATPALAAVARPGRMVHVRDIGAVVDGLKEAIGSAMMQNVFEPNDLLTRVSMQKQIENYCHTLLKDGEIVGYRVDISSGGEVDVSIMHDFARAHEDGWMTREVSLAQGRWSVEFKPLQDADVSASSPEWLRAGEASKSCTHINGRIEDARIHAIG